MKLVRKYRWALFVAHRYLFSKKSHNAINIITLVSMGGIAVGTMALVCVLAVLNGFEQLVDASFSAFDPDLRIESTVGRTFNVDAEALQRVRQSKDVALFSEVLTANALAAYNDRQIPIEVRGIAPNFADLSGLRHLVIDGEVQTETHALAAIGVANTLSLGYDAPLLLYAPKKNVKINLARPDNAFSQASVYVSGIFATGEPECDEAIVLVPISLARNLYGYNQEAVSSVELKLAQGVDVDKAKARIVAMLGEDFVVRDRYEQQADFYRILQIEKWITFMILVFILFIATCNVIGSLSMLMINKRQDTELFYALGARDDKVRTLFLVEGWLIAIYGALVGVVLGVAVCLLQQYVGIVKMGSGYLVENYPVALRIGDVLLVLTTVLTLGFALAAYPTSVLRRKK